MANFKHYFYSISDIILPGESKADFEKLVEQLRVELRPVGCAEEQTVLDIARSYLDSRSANNAAPLYQDRDQRCF